MADFRSSVSSFLFPLAKLIVREGVKTAEIVSYRVLTAVTIVVEVPI